MSHLLLFSVLAVLTGATSYKKIIAFIALQRERLNRRDLEQRIQALGRQEEQLRSDAARQQQLAGIAASLEAFRERVQGGLAQASFEQRRQLVLLLIDRVVVTDADVEIRYVLPTSPASEHVRFCHLRKDYFNDPAAGLDGEANLTGLLADDLDGDDRGCGHALTGVAAVGEGALDEWVEAARRLEHRQRAVTVLHRGWASLQHERSPVCIGNSMALAAPYLLARVIAARAAALGRAHTLAVHHRRTRAWAAAGSFAVGHDKGKVQVLPCACIPQAGKLAIGSAPRWQVLGQRPPRAATAQHIEDGVHHFPQWPVSRPPTAAWRR